MEASASALSPDRGADESPRGRRSRPHARSRGGLVLEIARSRSFADALEAIANVDAAAYNPFVLFIADANHASAVHAGCDGARTVAIPDGVHAITNWEPDARSSPKAARALRIARATTLRDADDAQSIAARLHATLADHGDAPGSEEALCVHRTESAFGTRSSTVALRGRHRPNAPVSRARASLHDRRRRLLHAVSP